MAARIALGTFLNAPLALRADALERAARSNLAPETIDNAKRLHAEAVKLGLSDTSLYDALLPEAEGNIDETLTRLATIDRPEARAAQFNIIGRHKGAAGALSWLAEQKYAIRDFGAAGSVNVLLRRAEVNDYQTALTEAESLPGDWLDEHPALYCVFRKNGTVISLTDGQQFH